MMSSDPPEDRKVKVEVSNITASNKAKEQPQDAKIDNPSSNTNRTLTLSEKWTRMISKFMKPVLKVLLKVTHHAATNPKTYVVSIISLSIALLVVGLATNFNMATDEAVWTADGTLSLKHGDWVDSDESGFPKDPRYVMLVVHRDGKSMLGGDQQDEHELALEGVRRVFESLDSLRFTPGYHKVCAQRDYIHPVTNKTTCDIIGITEFWNDNTTLFEQSIETNQDAIDAMSAKTFPSGRGVDFNQIIGYNECDNGAINCTHGGILTYGQSYVTLVGLPGQDEMEDEAKNFEGDAIDNLKDLKTDWAADTGNSFRLELFAYRSFEDEFLRAMMVDFPLLPLVFVVMSILCTAIYSRRDPVFSRSWLGFGAVVTVLLALVGSFGLLFLCGVPFTELTPLLPFIMFGVGLDDAFIISGAYTRTDHWKATPDRIEETIKDVGPTILLTTLTASVAFSFGLVSSIPAVRYLVMYAFPTILIDFVYQVTFFIALIVLDERRIKDNRRDCCFCYRDQTPGSQSFRLEQERRHTKHFADRAMIAYGNVLLKPFVKVAVLVLFATMFGVFSYSTTQLEQYFDFTQILPSDSYIQGWWDAFNDYYENHGVVAGIYFRGVDFSLERTRNEMYDFVQELVAMPTTGRYPFDFWLQEYDQFVVDANITDDLSFEEQLALFLNEEAYEVHKEDIVLDDNGVMLASRTLLAYDNHDYEDIKETVDALNQQEAISANQPVNEGLKDWAFFTWSEEYYTWEFYKVSPKELILTTILGTVSVSFLAMLLIPHWSAAPIVFFMLVLLYIDLLGFAQFCGQNVGPIFYISLVMSIGLMVDYVMHVTYRFMETPARNREEKTKKTLETIGASVLLGGASTLIGVSPMGFAQSEIFFSVFVVFFGLVFLGLLHGLVLLPVLLSIIGPMVVLENVEEDNTHVSPEPEDAEAAKPFE